jgi:arginyl-tRNA synthetase
MVHVKQTLTRYIEEALRATHIERFDFSMEQPGDMSHGDFATNVALIASKKIGESPLATAQKIVAHMEGKHPEVTRIDIAGPGFINFFLKDETVREVNREILSTLNTIYTGKRILVEHSSPNLFKPFHIGHLMNNIIGEFITRALNFGGANVEVLCFPSDISLGIAKAIYILQKDGGVKQDIFNELLSGNFDAQTKLVNYLGSCYVRGVNLAEENPELDNEIKNLAKNLYFEIEEGSIHSSEEYLTWLKVKNINTVYFEYVLESIGSKLGKPIFESEVGPIGKEIVRKNKDIFQEGEGGSIIYVPNEDRKDINTAVFINREGNPTYEAKDLGLIQKKFTQYGNIDISFFVTDNEQTHHFKIVLDAASKLGDKWPEWVAKSKHIPHGRMLFKGAKMSSRLGGVPLALDVVDTVTYEAETRSHHRLEGLTAKEKADSWKEIALSALRIAVLRSKPGININFDPETSLSFEGDSGPYLLYTHARCASLLEKGKDVTPLFGAYPLTTLERHMLHAESVFVKTIEDLSPQTLVTYLFSVAQLCNGWYAEEQIISSDKEKTAHNLAVIARVKNILQRGLYVLGIEAPDVM